MKSFGILRTNTGLSTNVKIIVDSIYNLFIETIDSTPDLSIDKLKKVQFNKENYYDELVPFLFKDFPVDLAFSIKYDNDNSNMSTDFSNQYDDLYLSGARNIIENKNYTEEYEYFAPLYIFKHNIPKYFIIFRIDGPGLLNINKDNFKDEFSSKFKTVKLINLTTETPLGEWIDTNFTKNNSFPPAPLEVDFNKLEFTRWIGIDYQSGGYTSKPFYLEENLENENTLFDFDKFFLDGYRVNNIIFPHIINFTFLFDDTPSTPETLRKWSINRYAGFYLDNIELIDTITPFTMPELQLDVLIEPGNIIRSVLYNDPFKNGFKDNNNMWIEYLGNFYQVIKFQEESTKSVVRTKNPDKRKRLTIEEVKIPNITKYKIVSDIDLEGEESFLNKRSCYVDTNNTIRNVSDNNIYTIVDFEFADINLIEINGVYHNLVKDDNSIKLNTDYGFKFSENNKFTYYTNSEKEGYSFSWELLITKTNSPKNWKIYRLNFTDIKDFDTNIIDTDFSQFEYEKRNDLTRTEEPKMYLTDLRSKSKPQEFDDFTFKGKTEIIPVSSDYTANLETFRIDDNGLTELWKKNPIYCRWGFQNSTSTFDYPYLLNNNEVEGDWNSSCDTQNLVPNRTSRNLDYFYTINSGTTSYLYHSLHIENNYSDVQDSSYKFEIDKYLEMGSYSQLGTTYSYGFDYFDILFSKKSSFLDGELIRNKKKYSYFNTGDRVIPNTTLFKGLKFKIFEVDNIKSNKQNIENINLFSSNKFQDYKFSILLSSNDWMVSSDGTLYKPYDWDYFVDEQNELSKLSLLTGYGGTPSGLNVGDFIEIDQFLPYTNFIYQQEPQEVIGVGSLNLGGYGIYLTQSWIPNASKVEGIWRNKMQWKVIKEWQLDTKYTIGDLVIYQNQIFDVINGATVSNPLQNPFILSSDYLPNTNNPSDYPRYPQLWSNIYDYTAGTISWVYNYEDYYQLSNISSTVDFWSPETSYSTGVIVNYKGRYFESILPVPIGINPITKTKKVQSTSGIKYWTEVKKPSSLKWTLIEIWDRNKNSYPINTYVVWEGVLYITILQSTIDDVPGESNTVWERVYSFIPDTNYVYKSDDNSIIKINDSLYYCSYNPDLTLDSGITIYINKKWKNVLVNISINDNTIQSNHPSIMDETKNLERDYLYVETNGRLTAANFIRQINDLDKLYGFSDYTSYVIIEEDGSFNKFNFNNLSELPYFILCEESDEFELKNDTLRYSINTIDESVIKPQRFLIDGNVDNIEKINFYNKVPLGVNIENSKGSPGESMNYNSQTNQVSTKLHRHSGYYMPIFYEVELFNDTSFYDTGKTCDAQFILDFQGTQSVTLTISNSDNTSSELYELSGVSGSSTQSYSNFYSQIDSIVESLDFLEPYDFTYQIYEPGNPNIHPNITGGYWVLSIQYDNDVCDFRISASQEKPCQSPLDYLFSQYSSSDILNALDNGGVSYPKTHYNICCPDCGPQFIGFIAYSTFTPFVDYYNDPNALNRLIGLTNSCSISATASGIGTWTTFISQVSGTISVDPDFNDVFLGVTGSIATYFNRFGIAQYGSPSLLSDFYTAVINYGYTDPIILTILSKGLEVKCETDVFGIESVRIRTYL